MIVLLVAKSSVLPLPATIGKRSRFPIFTLEKRFYPKGMMEEKESLHRAQPPPPIDWAVILKTMQESDLGFTS